MNYNCLNANVLEFNLLYRIKVLFKVNFSTRSSIILNNANYFKQFNLHYSIL